MTKSSILPLLTLILLILPVKLSAQTPEETEAQMDEIKLNESMIYGEDFNDDKDMAYGNALSELLITANELRAEKGSSLLNASDLQPVVKELRYSKGGRYVVMVYLPVAQMYALTSKSHSDVVSGGNSDRISQKNSLEPSRPAAESERKHVFVPEKSVSQPATTASSIYNGTDDILDILCEQDNWIEIKGFLSAFKKEGKISLTGAVTSASEVPEDAFSILIDDMGGILSILSPKNSASRIDHRTNQPDNESNHSNCKFIVWYK